MPTAIYKYRLGLAGEVSDVVIHTFPTRARILHVGIQNGDLFVWATVRTDFLAEKRRFIVVPTGIVDDELASKLLMSEHVGTLIDGTFVWHVFDAGKVHE